MRRLLPQGVVRGEQLVTGIQHAKKIRLNVQRRKRTVCGGEQSRSDFHFFAVAALPAPNLIRQQQSIDEQLSVIFRTDSRACLQLEDVQAIVLPEYRVDPPLNADRRGIALEFKLGVLQKVRIPVDELLERHDMTNDLCAKRRFVEEIVGNRRKLNEVAWEHFVVEPLNIGIALRAADRTVSGRRSPSAWQR